MTDSVSDERIAEVMRRPNRVIVLCELVRDGRLSAVDAARLIDESRDSWRMWFKRTIMVLVKRDWTKIWR